MNTWYFSTWTQDSGVANWGNPAYRIEYSLTGTIKWYVIASGSFWEVSRKSMYINGRINI